MNCGSFWVPHGRTPSSLFWRVQCKLPHSRSKLQLNVLSRILCQHWVKSVSTYRELWRFKSIGVYSAENGAVSIGLGLNTQRSFPEAVNRLSFYFVFSGAVFHDRFMRLILTNLVFILSIIHSFYPVSLF